jgi:hypothetical protein
MVVTNPGFGEWCPAKKCMGALYRSVLRSQSVLTDSPNETIAHRGRLCRRGRQFALAHQQIQNKGSEAGGFRWRVLLSISRHLP